MHDQHPSLADAIAFALSKLGPGVAGSMVALRGLPPESTFGDRLLSVVGGASASYYVAPALARWIGDTSQQAYALMAFGVGAFGLVIAGEITRIIREVRLHELVRSWIKSRFRIGD